MYLSHLKLYNFRNYDSLDLELNKNINIIIGDNAQGKTSLLESIFLLGRGKSYKNNNSELINWDNDNCAVEGEFIKENFNENIRIEINNLNKLNIYINKKKINKKDSLTKKIHIILFSPEDLKLIKEGPDNRRKFIDNELGIIKPFYGKILKDYNKVLYQRNNLLKSLKLKKTTNNTLEIWNEQLIKLGKKIIIYRINFLQKINKITNVIHNSLSNNQENLKLYYISNIIKSNDDLENLEETYKNLIEKNVKYDLEKGYTSIGPHLDDIKVVINNFDAKIYGSQGQQRTAALSMKLSEIELIKSELREYPIILLDDVMSELDINRQKKVIKYFDNMQVVFTCTELNFENFIQNYDKKIYTIHQGKIKNIK